jgi:hypothetical protein
MRLKTFILKLLKVCAYFILFFIFLPMFVLVIYMMVSETIEDFWPEVAYHWVYISAEGTIIKGIVYEGEPIDDKYSIYPPKKDGLVINEPSYDDGRCSRTYRLKDESLRIDWGNNDLTKVTQMFYFNKEQVIAKGSTEELDLFNEGKLFGEDAKAKIDAWRKKFRQGLNLTDDKLETCSYWFPVYRKRPMTVR